MGGDAVIAGTEDGVAPVHAVYRGTAGTRVALVARRGRVPEVAAPDPLAQVSAHRGHVPQLRRRAQHQRLRDHREPFHHPGRAGHLTHPGQRPDPQPAVRQVLDAVQRQVVDVDQQPRPQHVLAHQIHLGGTAGQERAVRALPDQRDRGTGVAGPDIAERPHHRSLPAASRTPRIAARMFGYAAHRQILPLIHSAISPSSPAWPSSSSFTADMICPGVQYPHWNASCSTNAACTGCSSPAAARPSIVVTSRPSHATASVRHASTRRPSTHTVHAPHVPWSQPFFDPVSPRCSRNASSRLTRGSILSACAWPFTVRTTVPASGPRSVTGSTTSVLITTSLPLARQRPPCQGAR